MASTSWLPIAEIAQKVRGGELKAAELVAKSLKAIEDKKEYNATISVVAERAKRRAEELDKSIANGGAAGRLAGVPFIAKDNFLTFGGETTAASNMLKGFKAPYQATAIERLEAEGAICVAKANLDAFAHGVSTENSDFGPTLNPHDKSRVPGGSSGGSAAAVMLDLAPFALGTDTGGSIRQPAAFCGVVGYKPTYGLVSRSGVIAMASSTDVIGPLAKTIDDAALVLDVIAGKDELDSTTIERKAEDYTRLAPPKPKRIGLVKEYMGEGLSDEVRTTIEAAVAKLKAAGHTINEISLPSLPLALACYYIIMPAEVSSNLSRYDGQHYGFHAADAKNLEQSYTLARKEGFGKENKRRIMIGTYVLSSGYYDAYYKSAAQLRTKLISEFDDAFKTLDFLVGPTTPTTAFKIGEKSSDPLEMYLQDILTVAANLTGIPAISIPAAHSGGLPVGLQLMAPQGADADLLALSKAVSEAIG